MSEATAIAFGVQIIVLIVTYIILSRDEDDEIFGRANKSRK